MPTTRRQFLAQTAAAATFVGVPLAALPIRGLAQSASVDTLRSAGAARNLAAGCCVNSYALRRDPAYVALVQQQAGILVAESEMKFGPLRPTPTTFFFDNADFIVHFAEQNNMLMRGHNFVWHRQLPSWFATYVTPQNAQQILVNHIQTVAGRYKGKIQSWDVVNEAIEVPDGLPGGLRNSPWQKVLPGYIDIAFRTAREADPHALLTYNDYGIEAEDPGAPGQLAGRGGDPGAPGQLAGRGGDPASAAKRAAVLALVRGMLDRKVPIDALGIQSHITAGPSHTYGRGLKQFMADVQSLGLKIMLTEMDVNDRDLPADIPTRDRAVADVFASYLNLTLANPAVIALLTWGITDKYTWLNHEGARKDGRPERCLPFDPDLKPAPAFFAELNALQHRPRP